MFKYFSKEQKQKRIEKNYKLGRVKFSILNSLFFSLGVTIFASLMDLLLNKFFGDSNRMEAILSYGTLFKFIFFSVFWFIFAYNYLWKEIVKYHIKTSQDGSE